MIGPGGRDLPRKRMFAEMTDAELSVAEDRAYREAARCWREVQTLPMAALSSVRAMLAASSSDATMFWVALRDERVARENGTSPETAEVTE